MTAAITNGLPFGAYLGAALIVGAILLAIRWVVNQGPGSKGLGGLFLGKDGRTSTSKVTAAAWTIALIYAYAAQLCDGRLDVDPLQETYLFLLGGPYAALVASKLITTTKLEEGVIDKSPPNPESTGKAKQRVAEVVSNDAGEVDIGDFQYFAFNLLALAYFFVAFVKDPSGLPEMPETLVGLSSAAAAGYLGRKGFEKDSDLAFKAISASPTRIVLGDTSAIVIGGSGFIQDGGPTELNAVMLDGVQLETSDWRQESVTATLSGTAGSGLRVNPAADLIVRNFAGRLSESIKVQVEEAPA